MTKTNTLYLQHAGLSVNTLWEDGAARVTLSLRVYVYQCNQSAEGCKKPMSKKVKTALRSRNEITSRDKQVIELSSCEKRHD